MTAVPAAPAAGAAPAAAAAAGAAQSQLSPSVYVGDLAPDVTEAMLWEHFRKVGQVLSVRVCIDFQTKKSLGYGYVNFSKPAEASSAIEQLNGSVVLGRACRVDRIQRDPTVRKSGVCNVVVKGLLPDTETETVRALFSKYGRITSTHIPRDERTGKLRGYAYVNFDKEESAVAAVKDANGQMLSDGETTITVERFKNMAPVREAEKLKFTNTYLRNLRDEFAQEDKLREALKEFGGITSLMVRVVASATPGGPSRGVAACVAFETHDAAAAMIAALNGTDGLALPGATVGATRFMTKKERQRDAEKRRRERQIINNQFPNLYVKHIDDSVTDDMLRTLFSRFGDVVSARIMRDETGRSREFGFVSFKDRNAAESAIQSMNGSTELSHRPLYIAHCVSKDARRAQIEEQARKRSRPGGAGMPSSAPGPMNPAMMGMPNALGGMGGMGGNPMMAGMGGMGGNPMMGGMGGNPMMAGGAPSMYGAPGKMYQMPPVGAPQMMPRPLQAPMMMAPVGAPMGMPGGPMGNPAMGGMPPQLAAIGAPRMPPMARPPQPVQVAPRMQGLDSQYFSTLSPDQQKNVLGERLYEHISIMHPQHASKVTGMLLEMDNSEILNLLDSTSQLDTKVIEALTVLQRHNQS
jgi:polyadenylate-binding protein